MQNWGQKGHLHLKRVLELRRGSSKPAKVGDADRGARQDYTEEAKPEAETAVEGAAPVNFEEEATFAAPEHAVGGQTAQISGIKVEEDPPVLSGENSAGGDVTVPPT